MKFKLLNFFLFQLGWFALILGAAWNKTYLALLIGLIIIGFHLSIISNKLNELKLILAAGLIGFVFDGFLQYFQFIIYNSAVWAFPLTPIWIVMLWMIFAITINHSLVWLKNRKTLTIFFGAIGGPLAYLAGEKLGAITIVDPLSIVLLSLGWATITPLLIWISKKYV